MSIPVATDAIATELERYGDVAFLVTVGEDGRPHTVSVRVELQSGALRAAAGRSTAANAERTGTATVLWPPVTAEPRYSLIVDGTATVEQADDAATVVVVPTRAVQHRQADADPSAPSCVVVGED